jgi:formylglycine-generating enzyme
MFWCSILLLCQSLIAAQAIASNNNLTPPLILSSAANYTQANQSADVGMKAGAVFTDCATCPEMVVIPSGTFMMGSLPTEGDRHENEGPRHSVSISKSYALGKLEITRGQYAMFVTETGHSTGNGCFAIEDGIYTDSPIRNWQDTHYPQQDNHPAACISWHDATAYIEWLSKKTGKHYRLPSEAEWEYAARGNTTSARFWGDDPDQACDYASVMDTIGKAQVPGVNWKNHNCTDGNAYTAPAGSKKPNPFGLYDMLGNVWEWTADHFHDNYEGAPTDGSAWISGGQDPVLRGGSWLDHVMLLRVAERNADESTDHDNFTGFRVVRELQ